MDDNTTLTKLIKENKGLICSIIKKYTKYYEFDDLYQVSIIGIIKAYQNFNKNKNVKFTTYAYKYILSEVIAYVNNSKLINNNKEYNKLYKKILETRTLLTQKLMKEVNIHDMATFLEIDEKLINDVIKYQEQSKSLDEYLTNDGENLTLLDRIEDLENSISIDELSLKEELNTLPKDERNLIRMRYFEDRTQSEVAKILGTNQVQVSRNEKKELKKLKNNLYQT